MRPSPGGLTSLTKHTKTEGCRTKEERANPESLLNHKKKHSKQRRQKIKKKNVNVSEEHLRDDILEGIKFQTLVLEEAMQKKESSKSNNHWGRFLVGRQETILEMDELMKDCMIESQERNIDESVVQQQLDEIQQKIISMLKRKASCLEMEKDSLAQEMVGWKMRIQRSGEIAMKKMLEWEEHLELDIDTADIEALQRLDQMLVLSQEQQTQLQTQRNRASTAEKDIDLLNGFVSNLHGEQSLMSVELDVISNECQKQQKENSLLKRQLSESAATFAQNEKKLEQDICSLKSKNETASSDLIKAKGWVATLNRELEELREQAAREAENSQNLIEQLREDKRTLENVREQTYALEEAMRKYQTRSGWGFFGRQKEEDLLDMDELMKDAVLQSK